MANYRPKTDKEKKMMEKYEEQKADAKLYFLNCIKPRLDRSYKLYISDNRDRAAELKRLGQTWKSNVAIPYVHSVVETLKPRILDARPDLTVQGRNQDAQIKAPRVQSLLDYTWEKTGADDVSELVVSSALIMGDGFMQVSWKKDVRKNKFLQSNDLLKKKLVWKEREQVFYDAPFLEWVDNYGLWYDWHNIDHNSKQYWFKRLILTKGEIERRYSLADKNKIELACKTDTGCLTDYASIRTEVKKQHESILNGSDMYGASGAGTDIYKNTPINRHEVFEWWRPFDDKYAVMVNDIPILKNSYIPIPYDFKEVPFIQIPYLKIPGEYEGIGIPMLLENPQIMLNTVKNQRLDASNLSIHKQWIVNPLANINKKELSPRPMGIIYSNDPNGAREVTMSDIKPSSYKEEEMLKGDMRFTVGVDDASMAVGGGANSATETRHLRESTLERVRLFVNHLGSGYSVVLRYWLSMYRQFFTNDMIIRIAGKDGNEQFPLISKDDIIGDFDFKSTVLPSIAGMNDVKKKQDMDLLQLLLPLEFLDKEKVVGKVLYDWNWNIESLKKSQEEMMPQEGMVPGMEGGQQGQPPQPGAGQPVMPSPEIAKKALELLGTSAYSELSSPVNLAQRGVVTVPPTVEGVKEGGANPRGMNRAKINTNIPQKAGNGISAQISNQANNIQR